MNWEDKKQVLSSEFKAGIVAIDRTEARKDDQRLRLRKKKQEKMNLLRRRRVKPVNTTTKVIDDITVSMNQLFERLKEYTNVDIDHWVEVLFSMFTVADDDIEKYFPQLLNNTPVIPTLITTLNQPLTPDNRVLLQKTARILVLITYYNQATYEDVLLSSGIVDVLDNQISTGQDYDLMDSCITILSNLIQDKPELAPLLWSNQNFYNMVLHWMPKVPDAIGALIRALSRNKSNVDVSMLYPQVSVELQKSYTSGTNTDGLNIYLGVINNMCRTNKTVRMKVNTDENVMLLLMNLSKTNTEIDIFGKRIYCHIAQIFDSLTCDDEYMVHLFNIGILNHTLCLLDKTDKETRVHAARVLASFARLKELVSTFCDDRVFTLINLQLDLEIPSLKKPLLYILINLFNNAVIAENIEALKYLISKKAVASMMRRIQAREMECQRDILNALLSILMYYPGPVIEQLEEQNHLSIIEELTIKNNMIGSIAMKAMNVIDHKEQQMEYIEEEQEEQDNSILYF